MKASFLLFFLVPLIADLHAGGIIDPILFGKPSPGEKGRPKITPRFENWGDETLLRRTGLFGQLQHKDNLPLFQLDGSPLKLSSLWADKPVLLVHSSLTCPISRDNCPHVDRIKADFGNQIEVVVLYTTEAHPVGSPSPYSEGGKLEWLTDRNIVDKILVNEPQTLKTRLTRAHEYRDRQKIKSRLVVDNMSNEVWKFFGGGPNTGIFIDQKGHVVARQGWLKPSLMAGQIRRHFANTKRTRVNTRLEKTGHEIDLWKLSETDISKIAKNTPEILSYNVYGKAAYHDETLLHVAVNNRDKNLISQLINLGSPIDGQDQSGLSPLHYALRSASYRDQKDNTDVIQLLLNNKSSLQLRSDNLATATHFAVHSNHLSHVKAILEAGAPLDSYSIDGISPLHEALFQRNDKIAQHLISEGASKDIFASAALGDLKNVKRLLINNPHAWNSFQGDSGLTPLIYAAIAGKTAVVEFLLSQQTFQRRYSNEQLVACLKKSNEHKSIEASLAIAQHARPLTGENAPPPTQSLVPQAPEFSDPINLEEPLFHEAATSNNSALLSALLDRGWDIDALSPDEETALHHAALAGSIESIELLLKRGADLEAKSGKFRATPSGPRLRLPRRKTPLHLAVISGNPATVETLLQHNANPNYSDSDGKTPLCHAFPNAYPNHDQATQLSHFKQIIRLLVKAGADPDKPADCGKSYRDLAAEVSERSEFINGEWVNLEKSPRSPELLKFLDEIKAE